MAMAVSPARFTRFTRLKRSAVSHQGRFDAFEISLLFTTLVLYASVKLIAHFRYGTSFDSALLGNVAWRLGNGLSSVSTLTGYPYFATHASGVMFLLAPIYRWFPNWGLPLTFIWQAVSVTLIGFALLIACNALGIDRRSRRLLLIGCLLAPGAFLATRLDVHEPTLGLGFLAMTLAKGIERVPGRRSWWWPALAAACRLELAAATLVAGLLLLRKPGCWRTARSPIIAGMAGITFGAWFIATAGSDAVSLAAHFAHLGSSPVAVVMAALRDPLLVVEPLADSSIFLSIAVWLLPLGLILPLIGWRYLLVALPTAAVSIFGTWEPADHFSHHYWYGFLVGAPFAAAFVLSRRPSLVNVFRVSSGVGLLAAWIPIATALPAIQPFGRSSSNGMEAIARISTNSAVSVSATNFALGHLIARPGLFAFPRPFICAKDLGPFHWNGEMPDQIIIRLEEKRPTETHRFMGSVLRQSYESTSPSSKLTVYRLNGPKQSGFDCIDD